MRIYLVNIMRTVLGILVLLPYAGNIWAEQTTADVEKIASGKAANDFEIAREKYNNILSEVVFDTTSKEKQLAFNKAKAEKLSTELRAKQAFLASLPHRIGKSYADLRRTVSENEKSFVTEAAEKLAADYEYIRQQTEQEIVALKEDLASVQTRIAVLEAGIKILAVRKEMRLSGVGWPAGSQAKKQESGVVRLERVLGNAMEKEIADLQNPRPVTLTDRDPYQAQLLGRDL